MSTKTYSYTYQGSPGTVDVTVTIPSCNIQQTANGREGTLDVTASIPAALPFPLLVYLDVDLTYIYETSQGSQSYQQIITIPAGQTSVQETKRCFLEQTVGSYMYEDFTFAFADQPGNQDEGSPLAGSIDLQSDLTCFEAANGQIIVSASGGSGGYTFTWADGPTGQSRSNLPAGTYEVLIEDSDSNQVTLSGIVIAQPTQIELTPVVTDPSCFGGSDGAITTNPSGGAGGYSFAWSDASTAQNRSGLSPGTYTVTVTDSSGCSRLFSIEVGQPPEIQITVNKTGKNIANTISGGTPPYSYLWSDGVILKDRTDMANGVYTFTVTDANGCQQTTTIVIQDFKFFFSKNPIWLQLSVDSLVGKENLSFVCEVYLEEVYESGIFSLKYSSEHPAKADGTTDFNVQQVLNAFLDSQVPEFGDQIVRTVSEAFKRFYLSYFEKYGDPPAPDDTTTNETFYVLYGGLSEQEFAKQTFFDSYLDTIKPFMSWSPQTQPIADDQHAYLHFVVNNSAYSTLNLMGTIRYTDGTSTVQLLRSVTAVKPFEVLRFPAGIQQLQLQNLNPSKIIASYDLQLMSDEIELSELRTFEVYGAKAHYRKLLYLNSLGGWDHVLCFGRGKQALRTAEETISRELPVGFSYTDREEETVSKSGRLTGQLIIATLNGSQRKHLIDLAISERVYEQTATGYLPVQVKFDFDPQDDYENLDEIGLEILYPEIRRYTPEL